MKRFFAAENHYGSQTSHGFANTWYVLVFNSRAARDAWVDQQDTLTAKAITRAQATSYAANWNLTRNELNAPKPFSGELWGIVEDMDDESEGLIGQLEVCKNESESWSGRTVVERFHK